MFRRKSAETQLQAAAQTGEAHTLDETLVKLMAASRGETDCYAVFDPFMNLDYAFPGVGEVPRFDPQFKVCKLDPDTIGLVANRLADELGR